MPLSALFNGLVAGARPSERLGILDWSERYVRLPHSDRAKQFNRRQAPWLNEILERAPDNTIDEIVLCAPVGSGKTTLFEVLLPNIVVRNPGGTMVAFQSDPDASDWAETRAIQVLQECSLVRPLFPGSRHQKRKTDIIFPHMPLHITGANMNSFQSKSLVWLIGDEVWRWKAGLVEEFRRRRHDKTRGKIILVGQAGVEGDDFHAAEDLGLKHEFNFECPTCNRVQPWRWECLHYEKKRTANGGIDWAFLSDSTFLECVNADCRQRFNDDAQTRRSLASSGHYVPLGNDNIPGRLSYHYNALCVWWISWGKLAIEWVKATDAESRADKEPLKQFMQKRLALRWEDRAAMIHDDDIVSMRDPSYRRGECPIDPCLVTLCADPGERQTHWSIEAWSPMGESYVIDWGTTLGPENVIEIANKQEYPITNGSGKTCKVHCGLIDSGDFTERIYSICAVSGGKFWPSKGGGGQMGPPWRVQELKNYSNPPLLLYTYTDYQAKISLYFDRIAKKLPPRLYFPGDVTEDFLLGHMGQRIIEAEQSRGKVWKKVAGDHYGDCSKLHIVCWLVLKEDPDFIKQCQSY